MSDRPAVVVFDVNETLSDLSPMAQRFEEVGAPGHLAATWFASVLRDGFALAAAGAQEAFATVAAGVLRPLLAGAGVRGDLDEAVEAVLTGFTDLDVHGDVPDGVRRLRAGGLRLVTLTNGSAAVSEQLFDRAGIRSEFERLLSVVDAGAWKPAQRAYAYAADACGTRPADMLLVAVHPWDVDGAARAGMQTAWIDRTGAPYPTHLTRPQLVVRGVTDLADRLVPA